MLALSSRATPRPCRFGGGREGKRGEAVGREEGTLGVEGSGREEEGGGARGPRVKKGSRGKKRVGETTAWICMEICVNKNQHDLITAGS